MQFPSQNQIIGEKYQLKKLIGSGSFGQVYLAEKLQTSEQFAIKILKTKNLSEETHNQMQKEVSILQLLCHDNIINFKEFFSLNNISYLVLEYCPHGNLKQYLRKHLTITDNEIWSIAISMLKALKYLHSKHILHRDIKLENILMFTQQLNALKLADFGFALDMKQFKSYEKVNRAGTMSYMSPEIFQKQMHLSSKNDIWSLGVLLYKLLNQNKHPFFTKKVNKTNICQFYDDLKQVLPGHDPLISFPEQTHPLIQHLIKKMLRFDVKRRISATDALNHPFITGKYEPLKGLLSCEQLINYEKGKIIKIAKFMIFCRFCQNAHQHTIKQQKLALQNQIKAVMIVQFLKTIAQQNYHLLQWRQLKQFKINQRSRTRKNSTRSNLTSSQSSTKIDSFNKTQGSLQRSSSSTAKQTIFMSKFSPQKQSIVLSMNSNLQSPLQRKSLIIKQYQQKLQSQQQIEIAQRPQRNSEGATKLQPKINLIGSLTKMEKQNSILKRKINQNIGIINKCFKPYNKN